MGQAEGALALMSPVVTFVVPRETIRESAIRKYTATTVSPDRSRVVAKGY